MIDLTKLDMFVHLVDPPLLEESKSTEGSVTLCLTGDHQKARITSAGPQGITPPGDQLRTLENYTRFFQVIISRKVRKITLTRAILSKLIYDWKAVTVVDLMVLYQNQIELIQMMDYNPNFKEKYGKSLDDLSSILREARITKTITDEFVRKLSKICDQKLDKHFILPERNWKDAYKKTMIFVTIRRYVSLGKPNNTFPPKRIIGKGYTDKGSAKDPGYDGSPSWQEVASDNSGKVDLHRT